jgi:dsRNA-specific ribonuclease
MLRYDRVGKTNLELQSLHLSDTTHIEQPPHRAGAISSREPKAFETTSPTAPDISLASALYGNLIVTDEKRERLEAITGAQLFNPINTKLIPGFDVSSVTAWPPVIWETIDNIPETTRKRAFRHRSMNYADNYETLEWMGDKFVGAALAEILHVQLADKHLAFRNIVCCACQNRATMNAICRSLGMHKQIEIHAHAGGLSDRICEDVFEAVAAAIHLELGYATLLVYLEAIYKPVVDTLRKQLEGKHANNSAERSGIDFVASAVCRLWLGRSIAAESRWTQRVSPADFDGLYEEAQRLV